MERRARETLEVASFGFDEYLQLVGGDPANGTSSIGLRVPALAGVRYLFLGARADLAPGDSLVGFRQLATIGFAQSANETPSVAPLIPFEQAIESPWWHFPDAFISWHLTLDSLGQEATPPTGPNDSDSFHFEDSSTPALLYETVGFPGAPAAPGYLGLNAYTPPAMRGTSHMTLRDVRAPWHRPCPMLVTVERPTCVRFYIDVLQSNPGTRGAQGLTADLFTINGVAREDNFWGAFVDARYWRVGVGLLIERGERKKG